MTVISLFGNYYVSVFGLVSEWLDPAKPRQINGLAQARSELGKPIRIYFL